METILYAKQSLKQQQRQDLERYLDDLSYTCGSTFNDVECEEDSILKSVYVKENLTCESPIELPYYSAGNDPICYYCGGQDELSTNPDYYPLCTFCHGKEHVLLDPRTEPISIHVHALYHVLCPFQCSVFMMYVHFKWLHMKLNWRKDLKKKKKCDPPPLPAENFG